MFANEFLHGAADLLRKCVRNNDDDDDADDKRTAANRFTDEQCAALVESILQTLYFICVHDSQGFINADRFELLLLPLVDQLVNRVVLQRQRIKALLPACLAQLAVAANDDTLWKQLNYQILLKTRSPTAEIRLFAVGSCVEVAKKLGNDFLPLLPETIPFFAEMLEDESAEVEKACQRSVQELERVLGEPLQKYF